MNAKMNERPQVSLCLVAVALGVAVTRVVARPRKQVETCSFAPSWPWSGNEMLQNEHLVTNVGFDAAENDPFNICQLRFF